MDVAFSLLAGFGLLAYLFGGWLTAYFIFTNYQQDKQYHKKDYALWIVKKILVIIFWPIVLIFFIIAFKTARW